MNHAGRDGKRRVWGRSCTKRACSTVGPTTLARGGRPRDRDKSRSPMTQRPNDWLYETGLPNVPTMTREARPRGRRVGTRWGSSTSTWRGQGGLRRVHRIVGPPGNVAHGRTVNPVLNDALEKGPTSKSLSAVTMQSEAPCVAAQPVTSTWSTWPDGKNTIFARETSGASLTQCFTRGITGLSAASIARLDGCSGRTPSPDRGVSGAGACVDGPPPHAAKKTTLQSPAKRLIREVRCIAPCPRQVADCI